MRFFALIAAAVALRLRATETTAPDFKTFLEAGKHTEADWQEALKMLDKDGSGSISKDEFWTFIKGELKKHGVPEEHWKAVK